MTEFNFDIVYGSEDCARVAEVLLAAGRAHEIPARLRSGILPEVLASELGAVEKSLRREAIPTREPATLDELEAAVAQRFAAMAKGTR